MTKNHILTSPWLVYDEPIDIFTSVPTKGYGNCPECGIELNDCNISCGDVCRECYDKTVLKVKPFPHDDFSFPIAKGAEQRRRIWLVDIDTGTTEGFVDVVSTVDVGMCFMYAFSSKNGREQFENYEWNGIEIFDPKQNLLHRFTCWDKHIFTHWEYLIIWMCSILNRCEYGWLISKKDFER